MYSLHSPFISSPYIPKSPLFSHFLSITRWAGVFPSAKADTAPPTTQYEHKSLMEKPPLTLLDSSCLWLAGNTAAGTFIAWWKSILEIPDSIVVCFLSNAAPFHFLFICPLRPISLFPLCFFPQRPHTCLLFLYLRLSRWGSYPLPLFCSWHDLFRA